MDQIKVLAPVDVKVILVANKSDCEDREITQEEGMTMAVKYSVTFFETSAKSGENIQELFSKMGELVREKILKNPP